MLRQDPLADNLALVINADFGLVVILGCANSDCHDCSRKASGRLYF